MFRVRRKFIVISCGVCGILTLTLYILSNHLTATDEKQLETELKRISDDVLKMGTKWDIYMEHQKTSLRPQTMKRKYGMDMKNYEKALQPNKCPVDEQREPVVDVQMLNLYANVSFNDIDGGAWKQGWNITYEPRKYNDHRKLKVFVVPHSHNDPGWIKTFDEYYKSDTKQILSNALRHLKDNRGMKFIWAEISFFSHFYDNLQEKSKSDIRKLVKNSQLEFVTGGWVMPDEANSHWYSVLLQLTEGQTWLKKHMNVTPISSWAIDPFGHSPTLPYILKKSGFENLLIQRTHYIIKKNLALRKQLEFYWRQIWDNTGDTELFTHMMPFYSYDIPHTCGPDPKVCCQFDFKRLPMFEPLCPWNVQPQSINKHNVDQKADMIVDQWKKKAELYRTNSVLIPLGDDFRYSQSQEWEAQRTNYQTLFEHINNEAKYHVDARFATLQEYFDSLHRDEKQLAQKFPTLSGDFFTYSDRADHYWSGYYTSRPYHKRMDRVLLHYVRSAELMAAWNPWTLSEDSRQKMQHARRTLSLFQHHDGITGTATDHVVKDYARRMLDAVAGSRHVMQRAAYHLLTDPANYNSRDNVTHFYLDDSRWPGQEDSRTTIILGNELPCKYVVFHNSLPHWRHELVDFYVMKANMRVTDNRQKTIEAQVSPVWTWHRDQLSNNVIPQASTTKYRLLFTVSVPPLGLAVYNIHSEPDNVKPQSTSFATNLILSTNPISVNLGSYPHAVNFSVHNEQSLRVGNGPVVAFSADGTMKSIQLNDNLPSVPIHLQFLKYGIRASGDKSGAYLFLPSGPATSFVNIGGLPVVLVTKGPLESSVTAGFPFVVHQTVLRGGAPEIRNIVDIAKMDDTEVVMRFHTLIRNSNIFYTDVNGLQIMKRKRLTKLPLQANYYPIPTSIFIEDNKLRLTVVTGQPLGGSSLASGEIEIMQDRRLTHDDERGLSQGILDNRPVIHLFRVILEEIANCQKLVDSHPLGLMTANAYWESQTLLHPIDKFIYVENDWSGVRDSFGANHEPVALDFTIATMRSLENSNKTHKSVGVAVHRTHLLQCAADKNRSGMINLRELLQLDANMDEARETTLTFLREKDTTKIDELAFCPMDTRAFIIHHRS